MAEQFPALLSWTGNTLEPAYSRNAELSKPEGRSTIPVSSVAAYGGDSACWNPEDLLAGSLGTCHMLTFLALVAKTRLEIRSYQDRATSTMDTIDRISRVVEIALRPVITVAPGTDLAKVEELFQKAHKYCVIANSVTCKVIMEPSVVEG